MTGRPLRAAAPHDQRHPRTTPHASHATSEPGHHRATSHRRGRFRPPTAAAVRHGTSPGGPAPRVLAHREASWSAWHRFPDRSRPGSPAAQVSSIMDASRRPQQEPPQVPSEFRQIRHAERDDRDAGQLLRRVLSISMHLVTAFRGRRRRLGPVRPDRWLRLSGQVGQLSANRHLRCGGMTITCTLGHPSGEFSPSSVGDSRRPSGSATTLNPLLSGELVDDTPGSVLAISLGLVGTRPMLLASLGQPDVRPNSVAVATHQPNCLTSAQPCSRVVHRCG